MIKLVVFPQSLTFKWPIHNIYYLLAFLPKVGKKVKMSEIQINTICWLFKNFALSSFLVTFIAWTLELWIFSMLLFSFIIVRLQGIDWNKKKKTFYFPLPVIILHTDLSHKPLAKCRGNPLSGMETAVHENGRLIWSRSANLLQTKGKGKLWFIIFRG